MKKICILGIAIAFAVAGCKKSSDDKTTTDPTPTPTPTIGAVPATCTKKVLIEEFTGAWCGYCVDGALIVEQTVAANNGKVIGVSIHQGDGMEIPVYNVLDGIFNNTGFPSGMVDRVPYSGSACINRGSWASRASAEMAKTASCGLAIKSDFTTAGDSISAEVHAGFMGTMTGNYKMVSYLVQDSVSGTGSMYDQHNYYSQTGGAAGGTTHPYYSLPPVITGFKHMQVVRKTAPSDLGEVVDASTIHAGGSFVKTYKFAVGTMNKANLSIVSFVYKVGTSGTTYEIMNVQKVKAGSTKTWD